MASSADIIKQLERDGFKHTNTKGSHRRYSRSDGRRVTVPHPVKDLTMATLRSIYRQAGWDWKTRG